MSQISAENIVLLLSKKHEDDVFVTECKNGPSWVSDGLLRLDVWTMKKSWAHPCMTGYEIKISRSDWLSDKKFIFYKEMCNELWLVSPKDIILPEEVPQDVGLMYVSSTGTRLRIIKKTTHREIQPPVDLLCYLLMNRVKVTREHGRSSKEFWEQWLEDKEIDYAFGQHVSKMIREEINQKIEKVQKQNQQIKNDNETLQEIKQFLAELGITDIRSIWDFKHQILTMDQQRSQLFSERLKQQLQSAIQELQCLQKTISAQSQTTTTKENNNVA